MTKTHKENLALTDPKRYIAYRALDCLYGEYLDAALTFLRSIQVELIKDLFGKLTPEDQREVYVLFGSGLRRPNKPKQKAT